jgi:hypothetical protein
MDRIRIAVPTRHAAKPEGAEQFISVSIWPNTDLWRRIVKPQPQRRANHRKRCDYERKRKNEIHPDRSTSQKIFALPSHNLTCPACQCPVECWKDRNEHRYPFVRKANGSLIPHFLTACRQRIVWKHQKSRGN